MGKIIWKVWDINGEDCYYSTEDRAYSKCVDIIRKTLCDNKEEMRLCLDELDEYNGATDITGYEEVVVDEEYDDDDDYNYDKDDAAAEHDEDTCLVCGEFRKLLEDNIILTPEKERGPRDMKFHIYNENYPDQPLCEDGKALEFDTEEDAKFFLNSVIENTDFDVNGAYIVADILYYDGGYINGTGCFINKKGHLCKIIKG